MIMLTYIKRAIVWSIVSFVLFVLLDLISSHDIDWIGDAVQSVVLAFVVMPVAEWIIKKLKLI